MATTDTVRIALAGGGAFGAKHVNALKRIEGVEVTTIISARDRKSVV